MSIDVWKSLDETFDSSKYLYHYTNVPNTIKILHSKKLIFSTLTNMNDISEYKARITVDFTSLESDKKKVYRAALNTIIEYFNSQAKHIRVLCFSEDMKYEKHDYSLVPPHWDEYGRFFDLTGRGCALPRMWAQYASNNQGVCLIFDKKKLLRSVGKVSGHHKEGSIEYKDYYHGYPLTKEALDTLNTKIVCGSGSVLPLANLFSEDDEFIRYNYFVKLKDWANEHEFRVVGLVEKDNAELSIGELDDYLVGVVVGEKIDPAFVEAINLLLNKKIELKKIIFDNQIWRFEE